MTFKSAAAVVALALLAACGNAAPTEVKAQATAKSPQRIISLSPTATEMLFAIKAGKQVVAADSNSNFPAEAPKTDLSAYQPNAEAIANKQPDLVVIAEDTKGIKEQLAKLKIPVLVAPAAKDLDDTYRQIKQLGVTTGHQGDADRLVKDMRDGIATALKDLPRRDHQLTYFHELDNTLYTVTSQTFIGQIYDLAGLKNVADPADKSGSGYPQLSAEYLVKADPDLVFLADTRCCAQSAATYAKRPGFANMQAVRNNHVVPLDDDVASRWGPRIVDLLKRIIAAIKAVPAT
ncbi:MAG: ABC transporter substrate-binding protein [Mycobacteriales bacterium]